MSEPIDNRPADSSEAPPAAPSRDSSESRRREVLGNSDRTESLKDVLEDLTESLQQIWAPLAEQLNEIALAMGLEPFFDSTRITNNPSDVPSDVIMDAEINNSSGDTTDVEIGGETVTLHIPNLRKPVGTEGVWTAGAPGRAGRSINVGTAESSLRVMKERMGLKTVISLSSTSEVGTAVGRISGLNQISYNMPGLADRIEANNLSARDKSFLAEAKAAYEQGGCLIHCKHGRHRAPLLFIMLNILTHPGRSFEDAVSATGIDPRDSTYPWLENAGTRFAQNTSAISEINALA